MFRFAHPYWFLLLLPLGAAAWALLAPRIRRATVFSAVALLPPARATWRTLLSRFLPWLLLAGLALTIGALARPQTVLDKASRRADAIAIQMTVDVSGSMEALDFSTRDRPTQTRLDVVKETFRRFIEKRPDDLIGLVTFGGYAVSRVPLTIDHATLGHALAGVQVPRPTLDAQGQIMNSEELQTAVGDGLATACGRLEKADIKSKIVVLLTDGESNTGLIKPEEAAKAAKALGIKVYTIGVGSTGRAPFITQDPFGRKRIGHAEVRLDEALLRSIATTTGGRYFNVRDPDGLAQALREIDKLEKTKVERQVYQQYHELFPRLLWPGAALIALAISAQMALTRRIA